MWRAGGREKKNTAAQRLGRRDGWGCRVFPPQPAASSIEQESNSRNLTERLVWAVNMEPYPEGGSEVPERQATEPGRVGAWWSRWRGDFGALRLGPVRRLVGADFASLTGDTMVIATMVFVVLSIGGGSVEIGIALAAQGVGSAAILLVGGVVADRYPRRTVMVAADLLRFGSQGALAVLLLTGDAAYWHILAAQLVHGIGTGFYMPASAAVVPDSVPKAAMQPTNALRTVARSTATLGGPALGALAFQLAGPGLAIAADAATFGISAAFLAGLPVTARRRDEDEEEEALIPAMRRGWREFVALRWLRTITVQFTLVNALVLAPFFLFGPMEAPGGASGGAGGWAALLITIAVGDAFGGMVAMSIHPERPLVAATTAFTLWAAPLLLLAVSAPLLAILAGCFLAGVGQSVFAVLHETTCQSNTPEEQRSRLMAFDQFGSLVGVPFGFAIFGIAGSAISADKGLLWAGLFLIGSALVVVSRPSVRELRLTTDERGADAAKQRGAPT